MGAGPKLDLPLATPELLASWRSLLQEDARLNGGTAMVLLGLPGGGVVRVEACSRVVIVERVEDPTEALLERALWLGSLAAGT